MSVLYDEHQLSGEQLRALELLFATFNCPSPRICGHYAGNLDRPFARLRRLGGKHEA